jgi:hypothetical protein
LEGTDACGTPAERTAVLRATRAGGETLPFAIFFDGFAGARVAQPATKAAANINRITVFDLAFMGV